MAGRDELVALASILFLYHPGHKGLLAAASLYLRYCLPSPGQLEQRGEGC